MTPDLFRAADPAGSPCRRWFTPAAIVGSLLLHAGLVASLVIAPKAQAARTPAEIPIEVVQLPPPAKPPSDKPRPPKAAEQARGAAAAQKAHGGKSTAAKTPTPVKSPEPSTAWRMRQLIGPMQALAMPALATGDNPLDDTVSYRQLVLSKLAKERREGRHQGIPGHVVVAFDIDEKGEVVRCEIREKSGDPALDAEAEAMVHRANPYPAPPPGAERHFSFGLRFQVL